MIRTSFIINFKNSKRFSYNANYSNFNSMTKSNYEVLGVNKNCTKEELKIAYYKLAKIFHPDINNNSLNYLKFQEIQKAYQELLIEKEYENSKIFDNSKLLKEKELDNAISKVLFSKKEPKYGQNYKSETIFKEKYIYPYYGIKLDYLDLLLLKYCYHHILVKQNKKDLKKMTLKDQNEKININHNTLRPEKYTDVPDKGIFKLTQNSDQSFKSQIEIKDKQLKDNYEDGLKKESLISKIFTFVMKISLISGISYFIYLYFGSMAIPAGLYIIFACFF
jgi:curved DNA-binding protein CbpA